MTVRMSTRDDLGLDDFGGGLHGPPPPRSGPGLNPNIGNPTYVTASTWLHPDRAARRHRRADRPASARGPGGPPGVVRRQPEADRPGRLQLHLLERGDAPVAQSDNWVTPNKKSGDAADGSPTGGWSRDAVTATGNHPGGVFVASADGSVRFIQHRPSKPSVVAGHGTLIAVRLLRPDFPGGMTMARPILPDELWGLIAPILPPTTPGPKGGRPRVGDRRSLTGILFILKTGMGWEDPPCEMGCGSGMTRWRRLGDWQADGTRLKIHKLLPDKLRGADRIDWPRALIDSRFVRAAYGGEETGPSPVDRAAGAAWYATRRTSTTWARSRSHAGCTGIGGCTPWARTTQMTKLDEH